MAFKIRAEFADLVIDATGHLPEPEFGETTDGTMIYICIISDTITGDHKQVNLTDKQLAMVLEFLLDFNGEPPDFEKYYEELEPIFKGWPNHLRPIP